MGRRSSKRSQSAWDTPGFDTVGMTILPGVSLPTWAEPGAADADPADADAIADATTSGAAGAAATDPVGHRPSAPQDWASAAATMAAEELEESSADDLDPSLPEPSQGDVPAMVGASMMAGATTAALATGAMPADPTPPGAPQAFLAESASPFDLSPAGAEAGSVAQATPPPLLPAPPRPGPASPAMVGQTAPTPTAPAGGADAAPSGVSPRSAPPSSWATGGDAGSWPGGAPAGTRAPETPAASVGRQTAEGPVATAPSRTPAPADADPQATPAAPPMPSDGWNDADRPQLSPEHVALLTWWAQMIEAGQLPAPPGADEANGAQAERPHRFPKRAAIIAVALVVVAALLAAVGLRMLGTGAQPEAAPAADVTLPAAVGDLVALTATEAADGVEAATGFGLRPAGVTVTGAYGPRVEGPLRFVAMATSVAAPQGAAAQIAAWAQRTGAKVGDPVVGEGATLGVTCATASDAAGLPDGSLCVWTSTSTRGQSYAMGMEIADAADLTAELRGTTTTSTAVA